MWDEIWDESSQEELDEILLGVRASSEAWKSDHDEYQDIIQENYDNVRPKSVGNTEHITLINMSSSDIFTHKTLMERIVKSLHDIAELLGISTSNASTLLRKYKWNRE